MFFIYSPNSEACCERGNAWNLEPRKGMGAIACAVASEDISMLKAMAKAPCIGEKMWDRTSKFVRLLTSILTGSSPMTWEKCIPASWVANKPSLPTLEAGAPLETTFKETPEAPVLPRAFYFLCDQYWSISITVLLWTIMNYAHRSGIEGRDPRDLQRQTLSFWQLVLQKSWMIDNDEP